VATHRGDEGGSGAGAFAPGHVSVALLQVRTLAGLLFAKPPRAGEVSVDPVLLAVMKSACAAAVNDHRYCTPISGQ
jgi:hypothetical protein